MLNNCKKCYMRYCYIMMAAMMAVPIGISAQNLKGNVESYETAINNVHLVKGNNGVLNLTSDTVVDGPVASLTAVLLDKDGKPVRSETYRKDYMGMGGVGGTFFSLSSDTLRQINGRIDTETGGMVFFGNTVWPEALHFERRGFDYEISWEEPLIWTDYKYQDGKLVQESTMGNQIISQSYTTTYEYNNDGSLKSRVLENKVSGRKERIDYYCHNGRIDSLEISYYNYMGTETVAPSSQNSIGNINNGNINNIVVSAAGTVATSGLKRERQYYAYNPDGTYQIRYLNDGTDKTEYYDSSDRLLKTVLPDGSVYVNQYNDQGDPVLVRNILRDKVDISKYDSYRYDSHGNWTRRRVFTSDEDGFLIPEHVEYRRFCYRDGERYESRAFRNMKLKPWYAHVIVSPDNKDMEIHIQQFSMGVEMKDIDDDLLNKLKMLPGFESDGNGNYTLEGHPLIISKIVVAE